jgi:hypothetical protein
MLEESALPTAHILAAEDIAADLDATWRSHVFPAGAGPVKPSK